MGQNRRQRRRQEVERSHHSVDLRSDGKRHGMQLRSGPLPSPDDFAGYETVLSGAAERLLAMAESEQRHRHALEVDDAEHDRRQEKRSLTWGAALTLSGMLSALVALVFILGIGTYLILEGHPVGGYTTLVTGTAAVIGVFVKANLARQGRPPER